MQKFGFLIDMDGVIYNGTEVVKGAIHFIDALHKHDIPFIFATNNSQRTPLDIATKLQRFGFDVAEKHIYTSAIATAEYLSMQKPGGTAFVIGEGGLLNALNQCNYAIVDSNPDYVIIGEGRAMTLESMEKAVDFVHRGAKLIATNTDPNCPMNGGRIRPGCGAYVKFIEEATGRKCFSTGKPSPIIFRGARKKMGLRASEVFMVGDTMETDILGGLQLGYTTILVLSGGSKVADLDKYAYRPDIVVDSVANIDVEKITSFTAESSDSSVFYNVLSSANDFLKQMRQTFDIKIYDRLSPKKNEHLALNSLNSDDNIEPKQLYDRIPSQTISQS